MTSKQGQGKDQFGVVIEKLRKVQAAMRACMRGIQEARDRAWEWRDQRDELRAETPGVWNQIEDLRTERDKLNAEVARLKGLRNDEMDRARELQEKLQKLREEFGGLEEIAPFEELQQRLRALEWQQQTTSTTLEEDRALLVEMEKLAATMEHVSQVRKRVKVGPEEVDSLWEEIQEARNRAQGFHEELLELVETAQEKHKNILELSDTTGSSRAEEKEAHEQFVLCLQEADELRDRLEELRRQEAELKGELAEIKSHRQAERKAQERQAMEKLAEQARKKQQAGEKLTMQELQALLELGGLE